jgi:hypothetical protein
MDTVTEISTLVLEELDFEIPCGHSAHNKGDSCHAGNAEYVALVVHDCEARPDAGGSVYPCCARWAQKVTSHQDKWWTCPVCKDTLLGSEMVRILGPLNT